MLLGKQLLAVYLSVTLTLIITCYTSKYYGLIYKLLNYKKKSKDNTEDNFKNNNEDDVDTRNLVNELIKVFSKHERFKNIFSENNLKLIAYALAFLITLFSKAEYFNNNPIINNIIWIDLNKVALESSVTFIAFDRVIGQVKNIKKQKNI